MAVCRVCQTIANLSIEILSIHILCRGKQFHSIMQLFSLIVTMLTATLMNYFPGIEYDQRGFQLSKFWIKSYQAFFKRSKKKKIFKKIP